jgi:hypothetical protein
LGRGELGAGNRYQVSGIRYLELGNKKSEENGSWDWYDKIKGIKNDNNLF